MDVNDAPDNWLQYAIKIESRIKILTRFWRFSIWQYTMAGGNLPANPMTA